MIYCVITFFLVESIQKLSRLYLTACRYAAVQIFDLVNSCYARLAQESEVYRSSIGSKLLLGSLKPSWLSDRFGAICA